jgi:hypothetical protein
VARLVEGPLETGRPPFRFPMVSLEFFIDIILSVALQPWGGVDSASNRNEYQKYFPGVGGGVKAAAA